MKNNFDIIIVGSGINALSCLYGILQNKKKFKIALITGKPNHKYRYNHPKIFKEFINSKKKILYHKSKSIDKYLPGIISGLTYFWGEQCYYNNEMTKNKKILKFIIFLTNILELKKGINVYKKKINSLKVKIDTSDKTITGVKLKKKFMNFFETNCTVFKNETVSINNKKIHMENGKIISGKKIFLCAGLIGTTNLLKSIDNSINFYYKDHQPKMDLIYSNKFNQFSIRKNIFNLVAKVFSKKNEIKYYLKFYPLKSLELLFYFKHIKFLLPKFLLNIKLNIKNFYFVQKWHNHSIIEFKNDKKLKKIKSDLNFNKLNQIYKKLNIYKIFSFTPKYDNFHYHSLLVIKDRRAMTVNEFLKIKSSNIKCLSLLTEKKINALPPTFMNCIKMSIYSYKVSKNL